MASGHPLHQRMDRVSRHIKPEARGIYARHCQRFLDTCRFDVEVIGTPPPRGNGCVLCHNESAFPDLMAYMVSVLDHVDLATAADLYKFFPFARGAFARIDFEMVRRGNRAATDDLIAKVVERVRRGERAAWGGEGELSGIDGIARFKIGASLVAIRAGVPLVPIAIHGGHHAMRLGSFRARPATIRIRFGDPMATTGMDESDARGLADRLQIRVAAMYDDLARGTVSGAAPHTLGRQ